MGLIKIVELLKSWNEERLNVLQKSDPFDINKGDILPSPKYYASETSSRTTLDLFRKHNVGLLLSAAYPDQHPHGFKNYVIDNGAWSYFMHNQPFNEDNYRKVIQKHGSGANWVVLPDAVGDREKTR